MDMATDNFTDKQWADVLDEWIDSGLSDAELAARFREILVLRRRDRKKAMVRKKKKPDISRLVHSYVQELYGEEVDDCLPLGVFYDTTTKLLDLLELELDEAVSQWGNTYNSRPSKCVTDDTADKILADFVGKL